MDRKYAFFGINILILALILSPGCTTESGDEHQIVTPPLVYPGNISGAVDGNNLFAMDYYSKINASEGNIFFSPWSISSALAMTYEGAVGKTSEEMASVMHFQKESATMRDSFLALYDRFNGKDAGYTISTANALWVQKDYALLKDYTDTIDEYYRGKASNVDYNNPEEARKTINSWVSEKTYSKIPELIPKGLITPATRLVLTNAIYFKGTWIKEFNKDNTREENFRTGDGKNVPVQMMRRTDEKAVFSYAETEDLQILEMPYKGEKIAMMVLLPKMDNKMPELEKTLTADVLKSLRSDLKEQRVDIYFPKFKFEAKYSMAADLQKMGMHAPFEPGVADFSVMVGQKDLFISSVIHQAFVEVNEEGTEAAAATAVIMTKSLSTHEGPKIPVFRADHPFIFLIQDKETGTILFMGKMNDPSKTAN